MQDEVRLAIAAQVSVAEAKQRRSSITQRNVASRVWTRVCRAAKAVGYTARKLRCWALGHLWVGSKPPLPHGLYCPRCRQVQYLRLKEEFFE